MLAGTTTTVKSEKQNGILNIYKKVRFIYLCNISSLGRLFFFFCVRPVI